MRIYIIAAILLLVGCSKQPERIEYQTYERHITYLETSDNSPFVGNVKFETVSIRLLVLKHCPDDIAETDGNQAVQAADMAATKGLTIQTIGNYRINKEGKTDSMMWGQKYNLNDLEGLKQFVSEQMRVDAEPGDTFIVYTIGHGGGNGSLMRLGQRAPVMKILAEAAEENDQETLWWQLSCHAAARLPEISTLNEQQQEVFSMTASSPANELSYFNTQGKQFTAMFNAMAEKSSEIDPDRDDIITCRELSQFLTKRFGKKRGDLVYARSPDEPIFGYNGLANQIPIQDQNNPQGDYPRDYIPIPKRTR